MNTKGILVRWFVILCVIACHRFGSTQTLYGPSGLIFSPSAYVPPKNTLGVGASTFTTERTGRERRWVSAAANFGLDGRSEIGLIFLRRTGGATTSEGFGGFAKYQLSKESAQAPAFTVGLDHVGRDLETRQAYLVVSKRLTAENDPHPFALTLGAAYVWDRDGFRREDIDVFTGFNFEFAPRLNLVAEWRSRTEGNLRNTSGVMLMYRGNNYRLAIGIVNHGNSEDHKFFIGAGFDVGTVD